MVDDWKIDRAESSRRTMAIDICSLGTYFVAYSFVISIAGKHGVAVHVQHSVSSIPKVYSLGYRPLWAMAPLQEFSLIELESSSG
jgi:hypothetical protein